MKNIITLRIFVIFFLTTFLLSLTERVNDNYGYIANNKYGSFYILVVILITTVLYSSTLAKYDAELIFKNHFSRWIFRFILLSFIGIMLTIQSHNYNNLLLCFYSYTIFYIVFEFSYNHFKNLSPFYIGNTAINDKIIRWINNNSRFMMSEYPGWYIIFKVILFTISILLLRIYWL